MPIIHGKGESYKIMGYISNVPLEATNIFDTLKRKQFSMDKLLLNSNRILNTGIRCISN